MCNTAQGTGKGLPCRAPAPATSASSVAHPSKAESATLNVAKFTWSMELSVEDIFDLEFIDDETLDEIFASEEGQYFIDESSEDLLFDVDDELLEEFF